MLFKKPLQHGFLFLLVLAFSATGVAAQTTYYVAPDGSDDASGTTESEALKTLGAATDMLTTPGDELVLLDGEYTPDENGSIDLDDLIGTETNPYIIRAQNERRAWIQGDGVDAPVDIDDSAWLIMEGVRASARDSANLDEDGDLDGEGSVIDIDRSHHVTFRRMLTHHPNFYGNASVFGGSDDHHILVEESEAYDFHRHGISFGRSDQVTIRRSFVNGRRGADLEDGWESHGCCQKAGDEGYSLYFTSNSILENSVSMHTESTGIIGGVATALDNPGGQDNQVLGSISYKDLRPGGFLQSRRFINDAADRYGGYTDAADSVLYRDYLIVGGQTLDEGADFTWSVARNVIMETSTFINIGAGVSERVPSISVSEELRGDPDDPDEHRLFLNCSREEVDGCDYDISNTLFLDNEFGGDAGALLDIEPGEDVLDFLVSYSNAYSSTFTSAGFNANDDADATDDEGRYRNNLGSVEPTGMGLGQGECIAFVPESSNMSGAGEGGADIGANILYRYEDGVLLNGEDGKEKAYLWDPKTGEFPHGAVIEGSPNDPSVEGNEVVATNIHQHLNVNTNGCRLPYATSTATGETSEVPTELRLKQNYPNPFNPSTEIAFALPQSGHATLAVYDVLGREVARLVDGQRMTAGEHQIRFEAEDLPSGMYVYQLRAGGKTRTQKMMLLR